MTEHWNERAACLGQVELMTEAHTVFEVADAIAVCVSCPVRKECLDAVAAGESRPTADQMDGIVVGGLTGKALADELRRRHKRTPAPIQHGTVAGARAHYRRGGRPCHACRMAATLASNPDAYTTRQRWAS